MALKIVMSSRHYKRSRVTAAVCVLPINIKRVRFIRKYLSVRLRAADSGPTGASWQAGTHFGAPSSGRERTCAEDNREKAIPRTEELRPSVTALQLPQPCSQHQHPGTLLKANLPDGRALAIPNVRGLVLDEAGQRRICPECQGRGFVTTEKEQRPCPLCCQWPQTGPLKKVEGLKAMLNHGQRESNSFGEDGQTEMDNEEGDEDETNGGDQDAAEAMVAQRKALNQQQHSRLQTQSRPQSAGRAPKTQMSEETKRRIAARMRKIHQQSAHRRRISEALTGRKYVCSICGEEGHNKRSCPQAKGNMQEADSLNRSQEERASSTSKGKTRKLKGIPYSELEAMRERRRAERREEHKDRPKTKYKGLTWHVTKAGKGQGQWHVQVWTGKTNKSVGYFDNELEAAREYDRAVLHFRGPSAQLNLPKEQSLEQPFSEAPQMPGSVEDATALAVKSILSAFNSGVRRQRIEYLLPMAADAEAGGVRQEFRVARNLVEATLLKLKEMPRFKGRISVQWLDQADCVGAWQNEKLAAVVFCTADCLPQLRNLDGGEMSDRLMLMFNPQWQIGGQILSDFGFGQKRRDAEGFVSSFQDVFFMQQRRVMGDSIRLLKCFGSKWQVYYTWPNGKGQLLVGSEDNPPSYQRLLSLLQAVPGSKSSRSWVERVLTPEWLPGSPPPPGLDALPWGPGLNIKDGKGAAFIHDDSEAVPTHSGVHPMTGLADLSSSPVDCPMDRNPVASPETLAAAAAQDTAALDGCEVSLPSDGGKDVYRQDAHEQRQPGTPEKGQFASQLRSTGPERFGDGTTTRNLQLDPLANMPQWQKQLLSNSFGHVRRDEGTIESERRSELLERKRKLAEELSRRRRSTVKSKRTDDKDAQQ